MRHYAREADWTLPELATRYQPCSTDRDTARKHTLEWVTPGHPLFEAVRRRAREQALEPLSRGAAFHSLAHDAPARIDFYRARVVDGLGRAVHERVFAVELAGGDEPHRCEPGVLGNLSPAPVPHSLPEIAQRHELVSWLREHVLMPFLEEDTRAERLADVERVADHVELSLTSFCSARTRRSGGPPATWRRVGRVPRDGSRWPRPGTRSCWPAANGGARNSNNSRRSRCRSRTHDQRADPAYWYCRIPSVEPPT